MRHILAAAIFALAFGLTGFAQTIAGPTQSPQGTDRIATPSPDASNPSASVEKKLKGCIQSQGNKYVLQDKRGKEISLGGSHSLLAHVGHTVTVHGKYGNGSDAASSATSNGGITGDQFQVSKVDMVSDTCTAAKGKGVGVEKGNNVKDPGYNGKPSPYRK